ncbi:peptidyl-prolyl cis-trans isomerase sig-7 [Cephus cinctus]|uniref:Peptidyl-prolyl cis-trans isomerase n=1 Tax=Cephus cinctus TaxID=211228 RepID=A0AAJ7BMS1_CEPCN|nr:peptidyl-prolyl cis-trans isomerase sig-7 [Cephus cinctus]
MAVVIETTIGDFTVDLYTDRRPQTCRNFLKLCKIKYYNWNLFHSVQCNFIAQTGDPTGTGKGGESVYGYVFGKEACYYEAEKMPKIRHERSGLLSMVNCGNNMLGSQFFITLGPELQSLDGQHCVFGEITEGLEIILKFNETICDGEHRPYQDIRISHTVILEDPYEDPRGLIVPDRSPEPTKEALTSDRIGADEVIDDTAGMTIEQIVEMRKQKEAKARATILEIVGDIPDADMAPPENVLFVCKLNPVTNDDDLEIIFSRFGKIIGCEVIRDRQTGDSLQYAFIEFENRKSCEEAYFKMDNVLIDDRRIHVDFSQSVAKMRWRGKGKGIRYYNDKGESTNELQVKYQEKKSHSREFKYNKRNEEERNLRNDDGRKVSKDLSKRMIDNDKYVRQYNGRNFKNDEDGKGPRKDNRKDLEYEKWDKSRDRYRQNDGGDRLARNTSKEHSKKNGQGRKNEQKHRKSSDYKRKDKDRRYREDKHFEKKKKRDHSEEEYGRSNKHTHSK